MTLWLSLLALALGAMGFVLYPLRRRALDDGDALRLSSNLATFEERRAELAEDLADGRLDAASHRALLAELDRALLADVGTATPTGVKMAARPARRVLWASAVLMPLLALLFYAPWGLSFGAAEDLAFKAELEVFDAAQAALGEDPTAPEIAGLRLRLEGLEQRLRSLDAKEPDGWFLVGQRAMDLGAFAQAATAFEEVEKLTGGALVALVYRAQALYLANDRRLDPTARALVDRVLAAVPDQPVMLELLAMDAFSQARYREAAETFRRVLAAGVTNPARRQFLEDAQRRAAELGGLDLAALGEAAPAGPGIAVDLTVAPAWLENLPAQAQLFILARPPGGRMPLAVERHNPATQLSVRLGPEDAMSPAMSIVGQEAVEVVARLSMDGSPAGGDGMKEVVLEAVPTAGARVTLALGPTAPAPRFALETESSAAPPADEPGEAEEATPAALRLQLSLAPGLSAAPEATVFVFARTPGTPMPLAVDRFLASELPREVVLDEGSAMIPGQGLRSVPALEVVARVTASGGVRAAPGDLEGRLGPLRTEDGSTFSGVKALVIDQVVE
ncbi:MAG: c-type cytochrome biogenesis protein CcmI [Pseudomonadota bacterium]|nr:c-type cytochrome biogenesis protein CcmI [Pseudomonadota bacterium]